MILFSSLKTSSTFILFIFSLIKLIFLFNFFTKKSQTGFKDRSFIIFPFGLPMCESIIIFALLLIKKFKVGIILSIRLVSIIFVPLIGTFKSSLIKTFFLFKSKSLL